MLQYGRLERSDLSTKTLWVTVWSWDRHGRNKFLGEARISVSTLDLTNTSDVWYDLHDYTVSSLPISVALVMQIHKIHNKFVMHIYHCSHCFPIPYCEYYA